MGNLFPDDPEYPDHRPIPSPVVETMTPVVTAVALTASIAALCPVPPHHDVSIHEHEHVPHHDVIDSRPVISMGAFGSSSSSGDDLSWMNNSQDVANDVVRRHYDDRRRVFYALNENLTSTPSAAILEFASRVG